MDVTLGRAGDYGIRALLDVARTERGQRRKAREIAKAMSIPRTYLARVLARLVDAGLLAAKAGRNGGYVLARPASEIRLIELVEAMEGPATIERCVVRGIPCSSAGTCAVHAPWSTAQEAFALTLSSVTLADIVRRDRDLRVLDG